MTTVPPAERPASARTTRKLVSDLARRAETLQREHEAAKEREAAALRAGQTKAALEQRRRARKTDEELREVLAILEEKRGQLASSDAREATRKALRRVASLLATHEMGLATYREDLSKVHQHLVDDTRKAARGLLELGQVLDSAVAELRQLAVSQQLGRDEWWRFFAQLEGDMGLDIWALRAVRNGNPALRDLPVLEPFGQAVYALVSQEAMRQLKESAEGKNRRAEA